MKTLYEIKDKYLTESNIEKISYLIFGGFTTLINLVSYWFFTYILKFNYMISSVFAWVFAVIFAFITNKLFVFKSYNKDLNTVLKETVSFFTFRILSLFIDLGTMFLCVQVIKMHSLLAKVLANIIVIVFNYFASKFVIFKKDNGQHQNS
ncbi:GtrA family protein [Clostridium neuense]|uniref:GtrA family protein n=1 Tax=Clostridium neuense TaxID=1728934 RepID=A0ABW8TKD9_9CLOT